MPNKDKYKSLNDIFDDADFHLIEEQKKSSNARTADERLVDSFEEIQKFVDDNGEEPQPNTSNVSEYRLYSRLKSLKENPDKIASLVEYDRNQLLADVVSSVGEKSEGYKVNKKPESIEDIFEDDDLDLLQEDDEGLFDFKHVPKETERANADFVARRKPCKDFEKYQHLFVKVQNDLSNGKRKLVDFRQGNLREGSYYIHNGVLFYLAEINITQDEHYKPDGTRVRKDGRTRCIFENGTESNMLKRSVEKILYANGKAVTENNDRVNEEFIEKFSNITDEDEEAGYIYVLKSKSTNPEISSKEHLYKIGYSKNEVPDRIKNAQKEPTYLMAPVEYVAGWKCFNMNPQKFEQLIHNFFGSSCLEVDVFDENGKRYTPREWFIAPLGIIEQAIQLIITGEIVKYRYDPDSVVIYEK